MPDINSLSLELKKICPFHVENIHIDSEGLLDLPIFRYMDIRSLLQIICDGKMFIARKESFSDWYEKENYMRILSLCSHFSIVGLSTPEVKLARHRKEDIAMSIFLSQVPISCWTTESKDSYLRWKTYDKGDATARIETTLRKIIKDIELPDSVDIYAAYVQYEKPNVFKPFVSSLFVKNPTYVEEKEIRLCFIDKNDYTENESPFFVNIKSPSFLSSILISTLHNTNGLTTTFVNLLKRLLPDIDIRESALKEQTK